MVSSTTPRPAPICPPVREQTSTMRSRSSSASVRSSSRDSERRSAGESIRSRSDMATGNLRGALDREAGNELERWGQQPDSRQCGAALLHQGLRAVPCPGHPQKGRICALAKGDVAAGRLSKLIGGRGDVEDVVGDLEGESDGRTIGGQRGDAFVGGRGGAAAQRGGGRDQRTRLGAMNPFELTELQRTTLPLEVEQLAANH